MTALEIQGFAAIQPSNVAAYLRSHGWQGEPSSRPDVGLFRRDTDRGPVQVKVVFDESYSDFLLRMAELADVISRVEARSMSEVVNDLLSPPGDQLRFRIDSEQTQAGTVGLEQSVTLRIAIKNLILAAAHSAIAPLPHFPRLSQAEAVQLLASCRERQSERGSYVASVYVPVLPPVGRVSIEEELGRRTTRLLASAMATAERAAGNPEILMSSAKQGVSANLLEALAQLAPTGPRSSIEFSVNWLNQAPGETYARRIRLPESVFGSFRSAAKALREASPLPNTEVEGYVIAVKREPNAERGSATVLAFIESFGEVRVALETDPTQHAEATRAHGSGARVRVVGTLTKTGRKFELAGHTGVQVLPVLE